jgi:hypothetical protein
LQAADRRSTSGGALDLFVKDIDWEKCVHAWCYGIRRFYSKEDIVSPESTNMQLLNKN